MADLMLESFDKFSAVYDIISLVSEKAMSEAELARSLQLSNSAVEKMVSFLICEGVLKMGGSGDDLRLTSQGFGFLEEFAGLRKFLG